MFQRSLSHVEIAVDVCLERAVELLFRYIFERFLVLLECCVVDEDVEFTKLTNSLLDSLTTKLRVTDIARDEQGLTAFSYHCTLRLFCVRLFFRQIDNRNVCAFSRKEHRDAATDA